MASVIMTEAHATAASMSDPAAAPEFELDLLAVLEGHHDRVWHVAWHPTLDILATTSADTCVRLYSRSAASDAAATSSTGTRSRDTPVNLTRWTCTQVLEDFTSRTARSCEWSPDGRHLAVACFDGTVSVFARTPRAPGFGLEHMCTLEGHENEVKSVSWASGGDLLATCGRDKSIWVWALDDAEGECECVCVCAHAHAQDVKFVTWHPTRELLLSASYDDTVKVWGEVDSDWVCLDTLSDAHSSTVWSVAVGQLRGVHDAATREALVSVSEDASIVVWRGQPATPAENPRRVPDMLTYKRACTLPHAHGRAIYSVDVLRTAEARATPGQNARKRPRSDIADASARGEDDSMEEEEGDGDDAPQLPPRLLFATAGGDDYVRIFAEMPAGNAELDNVRQVAAVKAHDCDVNCVRWSPRHAGLLATAGDDGVVKLWHMRTTAHTGVLA